MAFSIYKLMWR